MAVGRTPAKHEGEIGRVLFSKKQYRGVDSSGAVWQSRDTGLASDQLWLVAKTAANSWELRPVINWLDFQRPLPQVQRPEPDVLLRRAESFRHAAADRLQAMLKRPENEELQEARESVRRKLRPEDLDGVPEELLEQKGQQKLLGLERFEAQQEAAALKPLPSRREAFADPALPSQLSTPLAAENAPPTQEKQEKRKRKRKAQAMNQAEDEAAPETANELKQLKTERAEGVWDFEAGEELFSDDEEADREDLPEEQEPAKEGEVVAAEHEEFSSEDEGELLTTAGKELEALLQEPRFRPASWSAEDLEDEAALAPKEPAPAQGRQSDLEDLRTKIVHCLLKDGGSATLKSVAKALRLKSRGSALWNNAMEVLREVARISKQSGEVLIQLHPQYLSVGAA